MKIIFLDIDGVITLPKTKYREFHNIRPLKKIIDATDAYIVISSAWRLYGIERLRKLFKEKEIEPARIIDMTPRVAFAGRGEEIEKWLKDVQDITVDRFVIIDDDIGDIEGIFEPQQIIKPNRNIGLTYKNAEKAIKILGGK